ncbi:MAG: DMT family transporter [Patescibacteria group bacterium]
MGYYHYLESTKVASRLLRLSFTSLRDFAALKTISNKTFKEKGDCLAPGKSVTVYYNRLTSYSQVFMNKRHKAYAALIANALIWGAAFPLVKKGFEEIEPMAFLFYRYLIASLISIPILILFWRKLKCKVKDIPELLFIGFLSNCLAHWVLYVGLDKTSSIEASLLTSLVPIFIVIGASIFLKEKVTKTERVGVGVAFTGSMIVVLEPLIFQTQKLELEHFTGNALVFSYNIIWTLSILWMKKVAKKYHPFTVAAASFFASTVGFAILAFFENPSFLAINYLDKPLALSAFIYMGTIGSVAALFLYQYGQKQIEASEATLFTYLTTLFAVPLAILWLKETPTVPFILGALVIVSGIVIAEKRWRRS